MLNHNLLQSIFIYTNDDELLEVKKNSKLEKFTQSMILSPNFWYSKMIINNISSHLVKNPNHLEYEKYRTNRKNQRLFYQNIPILYDIRFIVKIEDSIFASTRNKIYRIYENNKCVIYSHNRKILALAANTTNIYFIDKNYIIYDLVVKNKTAKRLGAINREQFKQRIIPLSGICLKFRSDILSTSDFETFITENYKIA